ncbi:hypothetical protein VKT23_000208 [Stygiomarasmius scandens]|uniref:Uncharacterized protein n=1 Tax=Marasmiellus scandens TaxID=2682957 RepID=A0ABR1K3N0_9AGAR
MPLRKYLTARFRALADQPRGRRNQCSHPRDELQSVKTLVAENTKSQLGPKVANLHGETAKTLKRRTLERPTQLDVSAADAFPKDDIKRMLTLLNAHISLFATQIVLSEVQEASPTIEVEDLQLDIGRASEDIEEILGDVSLYLCKGKKDRSTDEYGFVVQHALQALLSGWCVKVIQTWSWSEEVDKALKEMYARLLATGSPATFGKWRATTRAQCKSNTDAVPDEYLKVIQRATNSVVAFEILIDPEGPILSGRQAWIHDKVASILQKACQIREIIGEKITFSDFEVLCPRFGDSWVEGSMFDIHDRRPPGEGMLKGSVSSKTPEQIFCTSQMGLQENHHDAVSQEVPHVTKTEIIMKASVLPMSGLTSIDE